MLKVIMIAQTIAQLRLRLIVLFGCSEKSEIFASLQSALSIVDIKMTLGHFICTVGLTCKKTYCVLTYI
jgi:hypothetical protein